MGSIKAVTGKVDLGKPEHAPERGKWNLPFTVELKENIHIHWQDLRIEMNVDDLVKFSEALQKAVKRWEELGKPKTLPVCEWLAFWPGEEQYHFYKDRLKETTEDGTVRHHFRTFDRTEGGKGIQSDNVLQLELQHRGQYHFHYKNFRIELGAEQTKQASEVFKNVGKEVEEK